MSDQSFPNKGVMISSHAFTRFFERILGYDLAEVYSWILPQELLDSIKRNGDGVYQTNKYKLVVKNRKVVTVLAANQSPVFSNNIRRNIVGNAKVMKKAAKALHFDKEEDQLLEDYYRKKFRL